MSTKSSLWRKFLCFFGVHRFKTVESNTFGIIMLLSKEQCTDCEREEYIWSTFGGGEFIDKDRYEGMLASMSKVSEACKGTGAESRTQHYID